MSVAAVDETMSLRDELAEYPAADEPQYSPAFEFDGTGGSVQTGPMPIEEGFSFEDILRRFGKDPDLYEVAGEPQESIWEQRARNRETNEFETTLLHAWKARFRRKLTTAATDLEALIAKVRKTPPGPVEDGYWFVFQAGDQQLGKRSREGSTEEIIQRYLESVENAAAEFKSLKRHGIAGIQLSFPGDCLEGVVSQGSRNMWLTQETITEQVRIFRRLLYHTIERLSPLAGKVIVTVVNGNHDQSQRDQNTYPGDGWATEAAIAVADQIKMNDAAFGHVDILVPDKWRAAMTVPIGDTIVTVIHGHQWSKGKAMDWLAKQAVNNHSPGAAQVLQHGHWHSWATESNAKRIIVTSPTFEVASDYLINTKGSTAKRGALVYLMKSGEVSRMSVV